jgi:cytochrome b561
MKRPTVYPLSVSLLHWALAAALIGNLALGWMLDDNEDLVGLHRSIGIAILGLVVIRLVNRLRLRRALPDSVNEPGSLTRFAEHAVHFMLYAAMLAIPLLGWMKTDAAGHPVSFFGLFSLPPLLGRNHALSHWLGVAHAAAAYGLVGLIALHVSAAVIHRFVTSENVLARILPFRGRSVDLRQPALRRQDQN